MRFDFVPGGKSTIGVEWELALVDATTLSLAPRAQQVLDAVDDPKSGAIRREYLTDMIELVTGVHHRVDAAMDDLRGSLHRVREILGDDTRLLGAGSHPIDRAADSQPFDFWRYNVVKERNAYWGRQMAVFGTHIHVGVDHRDKALPITYGLARFTPYFIALSGSSPYWEGEDTGYASQRTLIFQQLPTNGLPYPMETWDEFEHYASELEEARMISAPNEIRWDVRPSTFGTVENRVLDSVPTFAELAALTALTQCLAEYMSRELDDGRAIAKLPVWFMKENRWRAARYGLDTDVITPRVGQKVRPMREGIEDWLNRLEPIAAELGCGTELAFIDQLLRHGPSYVRQRAAGGPAQALRQLVDSTGADRPDGLPLRP
ncbi:carboxylate-amine ligase [Micropruina sonneratiae]|uniref:carboxylate-amine ligase n=1 Tax=Micropruina sonneratiae TaxID=2986940 RepID=UPI00222747D1|nr:YbdK family carboxylate-amine ligase [Micropruina sp. KQZ13P-5]MCW3159320.1 YbdK family carboxylate-amine ligase [Micropruina sp. KQZ13P-5]